MTAPKNVQLRCKEDVLEAFSNWKMVNYSLTAGKQLLFKYDGDSEDEAEQLLDMWLENLKESAAIYTLNVFQEVPPKGGIKINSLADGSINFQLNARPASYAPNELYTASGGKNMYQFLEEYGQLKERNARLIERLAKAESDLDDLEHENEELQKALEKVAAAKPGMNGMLESLMPMILSKIGSILGGPVTTPAAAINGIGDGAIVTDDQKIQQALPVLFRADPQFADSLLKLAKIAETQPQTFAFLLQQLKAMSV